MSLTDEDLRPFLDGTQGVPGLDLARELVATRVLLVTTQAQCIGLSQTAEQYAAVAETAMAELASAKARLESICESLCNMNASVREYLG